MKTLWIRTLTGGLFVLVVMGALWAGPFSFLALFSLISAGLLLEFLSLPWSYPVSGRLKWSFSLIAFLTFCTHFLWASGWTDSMVVFLPLLFLLALFVYILYCPEDHIFESLSVALLGLLYIALPFSLLNQLVFFFPGDDPSYTPILLTGFFALLWANDSGAYLVGVSIGRHRLFERISPKKSWEGFWGGLLFTLGTAYGMSRLDDSISVIHWLVLGGIVTVAGTWGDLFESLLKRTLGVKDSGNILPGHGGLLDRFDSILFAGPTAVLYLWWVA